MRLRAYSGASATTTLEVGGNAVGQGRVKKIALTAHMHVAQKDADTFTRIEKIMRQGCLVTGSLHDGIEMEYTLFLNSMTLFPGAEKDHAPEAKNHSVGLR